MLAVYVAAYTHTFVKTENEAMEYIHAYKVPSLLMRLLIIFIY